MDYIRLLFSDDALIGAAIGIVALVALYVLCGVLLKIASHYKRIIANHIIAKIWPSPTDIECFLKNWTPAETHSYTLLITGLTGDKDDHAHRRIISALEKSILQTDTAFRFAAVSHEGRACVISLPDGADRKEQLQAGHDAARQLGEAAGADMVIWGQATGNGARVDIHFTEGLWVEVQCADFALKNDGLTLETTFLAEIGALIAVKALSLTSMGYWRKAAKFLPQLQAATETLRPIALNPPLRMGDKAKGDLIEAFAQAQSIIAEQSGDRDALETAAAAYRLAAAAYGMLDDKTDWTRTQNSLGNALATLGEDENGTERLEEAVDAYRAAQKEVPQERIPLDWAMTQNRLGNALRVLGERESGTKRLEEAVDTYRAALKECARESPTGIWAMIQNQIGDALVTLSERESGTKRLEEAVEAFRAALKPISQEEAPIDWAMSQHNLGLVLTLLAGRTGDRGMAGDAVTHATAARDVLREAGHEPYRERFEELLERVEEHLAKARALHDQLSQ